MTPFERKLQRRIDEIGQYRYHPKRMLSGVLFREGPDRSRLVREPRRNIKDGEAWGGRDRYAEFIFSLPSGVGTESILLFGLGCGHHLYGPEALVFFNDQPVQALDAYHHWVPIPSGLRREPVVVRVEAWSGLEERRWIFYPPCLAMVNQVCRCFYHDAKCALETARLLDEEDVRYPDILNELDRSLQQVDFRQPGSPEFYRSIKEADLYLHETLYGKKWVEGYSTVRVTAVGHCHIDLAWLWRLEHTRHKTARSFATAVSLLERYPAMVFSQGQAQLYEWVQNEYPVLFERVRRLVGEGRWETGSLWVEPDCNLPSGESLIRQFLVGKTFFQEIFNAENQVAWLPDTFGFNGNLPQILRGCGMSCFLTTKISWNALNRFPYDTFWWEGIDGSRVLAHFVTTPPNEPGMSYSTYNGVLEAGNVQGAWERYREQEHNRELLFTYGYGDGGGGPTADMLENALRLKAFPFLPWVRLGGLEDFGRRLACAVEANPELPSWKGELYLEFHQGTYTTQGWLKKTHRELETLYRQVEAFSVVGRMMGGVYPKDELARGWKTILLHQFHDILAGSSIREVYDDTRQAFESTAETGHGLKLGSLHFLCNQVTGNVGDIVVFNPHAHLRSDPLEIAIPGNLAPGYTLYQGERPLDWQSIDGGKCLVSGHRVPGFGYASFKVGPVRETQEKRNESLKMNDRTMENRFFRLEFDQAGLMVSLYHKGIKREYLDPLMPANCFQAFEDLPPDHDAWNIDPFYRDKSWLITELDAFEIIERGPLRGTIKMVRSFGQSLITQHLSIYRDADRIDFLTEVDWRENNTMLKVIIPVNLFSDQASYEIQLGYLYRSTRRDTSWEKAKFEVCAQRWVDLSEKGAGIALLNNGKYGHDIVGGVISLTCLRSPSFPDPGADRGKHQFAYALFPHEGEVVDAPVTERAAEFNEPLVSQVKEDQTGSESPERSWIMVEHPCVALSAVKLSETGEGMIVRLYESRGTRMTCQVSFWKLPAFAWSCSLVEEKQEELTIREGSIVLTFHPFEIKTILVGFEA